MSAGEEAWVRKRHTWVEVNLELGRRMKAAEDRAERAEALYRDALKYQEAAEERVTAAEAERDAAIARVKELDGENNRLLGVLQVIRDLLLDTPVDQRASRTGTGREEE